MAQQNKNAVFYATTYHPIQAGSIDGTDTASHDNGVYRALVASSTGLYDPTGDRKAVGDPYNTLFIGRLARHTTDQTLHEAMSKYGKIKHLRLVRHIVTGASRGYAFAEFENEEYMRNAYELAQHQIIDGSAILVDYNRQQLMPGWIPRRLGGGLGGCKESGQLRFGGRDRPFRAPLRIVPQEELSKLGVPLPPVDQYMSRFQLPPTPRPPGSRKEPAHHKQKYSHRRSQSREASPFDYERTERDQRATSSSRSGRRSVDEGGSSSHKKRKSEQDDSRDAERSPHEIREVKTHRSRRSHAEHDSGQAERRHRERSSSRASHTESSDRHRRRSRSRSRESHRDRGHRHRKEQREAYDKSP